MTTQSKDKLPFNEFIALSPLAIFSILTRDRFPFNLSLSEDLQRFNYGYSSVEIDPAVIGQDITITKVRVDFDVRANSELGCCDVWVLLGPETILGIHDMGQASQPYFYVSANSSQAPIQAQFVVGNKTLNKDGVTHYSVSYDFRSATSTGDVNVTKGKAYFSPPVDLQRGLYAQILFWAGSLAVNLDVLDATLVVEGTKRIH